MIVRPNAVHGVAAQSVAVDQTTGIRLVVGIVFEYLAVHDAVHNVIERETVGKSFFFGMIRNADSLLVERANDVVDVH